MLLPTDYPDDFAHTGLREAWFDGIPWSIQSEVMGINSRLRCIRNPVTQVFVLVIKTNPEDRDQTFPFFGAETVFGWQPVMETKPGFPVEYVHQMCEGMRASERYFAEHFGDSKASMEKQLIADHKANERTKDEKMRAMSRFTRNYAQAFRQNPVHQLGMGMSPRKRFEKFRAAQSDFLVARDQTAKLIEESVNAPLIVVA